MTQIKTYLQFIYLFIGVLNESTTF